MGLFLQTLTPFLCTHYNPLNEILLPTLLKTDASAWTKSFLSGQLPVPCSLNTSPGVASCAKKSPTNVPFPFLHPLIGRELAGRGTRNHGVELVASRGAVTSSPDLHPRTVPPALGTGTATWTACTPSLLLLGVHVSLHWALWCWSHPIC